MVKLWENTKEKKKEKRKEKGKKKKERKKEREEEREKDRNTMVYHSRFLCSCSSQTLFSAVCFFRSSCNSLTHSSRRLTSACSSPLQCSRLVMAALHCWIVKSASNC